MNPREAAEILSQAYATFPHLTLTPHAINQWLNLFSKTDSALFSAALNQAILDEPSAFFPSPSAVARIVRAAERPMSQLETAEEAWEAAWNDKPKSQRTKRTIELMPGWDKRGQWLVDSMPFKRKDFIKIYEQLAEKDEVISSRESVNSRRALSSSEKQILKLVGMK